MKAFVVRPFGAKRGIDFEKVHKDLIMPALDAVGIQGGTTAAFLQAGNIRADMFQQLLVADIVVADISIHNANVFYELGIRHALQPMRTYMLRAKSKTPAAERTAEDEVPFDLRTDRYLEYDPENPAAQLETFTGALRQTLASEQADSPVFRMLPDLEGQDRARFLPVPQGFRDDVELAFRAHRLGLLGLLAMEAQDFFWASEGLRLIGRAQINLKSFRQARDSWEALFKLNPLEPEANHRLATVYQRLNELDASDQALQRLLSSTRISRPERAEALSLLARNIKDRWRASWWDLPADLAPAAALRSPHLVKSYEKYAEAFRETLDSFYAGLNALSLLTLRIELAKKLPKLWRSPYDSDAEGDSALAALESQRVKLSGAVSISLDAARETLKRAGASDVWVDISAADYLFLTSTRPEKVAFAYQDALPDAADFNFDSARAQLVLFQRLGLLADNTEAALAVFQPGIKANPSIPPARVILFTGHMIDPPESKDPPRFPDSLREAARAAIRKDIQQEMDRTNGAVIGIASAASGGDLLFHEVCAELNIEHHVRLPLPPDTFRNESVSPAGQVWEDKFDTLLRKSSPVPCLARSETLPVWLAAKQDYTAWQRANLWLIHEALALGAESFTLLALWDGVPTTGLGGVYHMRTVAAQYGAAVLTINTGSLRS